MLLPLIFGFIALRFCIDAVGGRGNEDTGVVPVDGCGWIFNRPGGTIGRGKYGGPVA